MFETCAAAWRRRPSSPPALQLLRHRHAGEGRRRGWPGRAARQRVFVNAIAEPGRADVGANRSLSAIRTCAQEWAGETRARRAATEMVRLAAAAHLAEVADRALAVLVDQQDLMPFGTIPGSMPPPQHASGRAPESLLPDVQRFRVERRTSRPQATSRTKQAGAVRGGGRRCHSAAAAAAAVTVDGRRRQRAAAARLQESVRRRQSQQRLRRLRRVAGERRQEGGFELYADRAGRLGGQRVATGRPQQMQACAREERRASAAVGGAAVRAANGLAAEATWSVKAQLRHRHHQREALIPRHVPQIRRDERSAQRVQPGQHLRITRARWSSERMRGERCGMRGGHVQSAPSRAAAAAPPRRAATT